ncbi:hypothetical protein E2C01_075727 [Portunus trituberculatus]|uniref:Uncharacterized protein n=1 Tax=Portunus trituberculatus TaxID=210409 RepID=A0A5B7IGI8_PORTR|nr:hypothetical protein [Portunus trituberculatus]
MIIYDTGEYREGKGVGEGGNPPGQCVRYPPTQLNRLVLIFLQRTLCGFHREKTMALYNIYSGAEWFLNNKKSPALLLFADRSVR